MAIKKPKGMSANMFASLVQGVDVLYSEWFDKCAENVKYLIEQHDALNRNNRTLRNTITHLNSLCDELRMERDDLEKQLEVKTNEAQGLATQLHEERMRGEECHRQLLDANRELEAHANEKQMMAAGFNQACKEIQHKYKLDAKTDAELAAKPVPVRVTESSDMQTINELAFTCSTPYLRKHLLRIAEGCGALSEIQSALVAAAGDRLGVDTFPGARALRTRPTSKGELAAALYPEADGYTVDCALPSTWLNVVHNRLSDDYLKLINEQGGLAAQFVTVYDDKSPGGCVVPVTRCGVMIMAGLVNNI